MGEDELRWIINFDETNHQFTTQNEKEGSQSIIWGDPTLAKFSDSGTQGSRHTTVRYGANAAGEAIPPI